MSASGTNKSPSIGFLSVVEHEDQNLYGGYLILNPSGRPLEFHCTAPVRANRAQEILYGATLKPYLYGEQIGRTLLGKASSKPLFLCTDELHALTVRQFIKTPTMLIVDRCLDGESTDSVPSTEYAVPSTAYPVPSTQYRVHNSEPGVPAPKSLQRFTIDGIQAATLETHIDDQQAILDAWQPYRGNLDLFEPFTRIREAIEEAQCSVTR